MIPYTWASDGTWTIHCGGRILQVPRDHKFRPEIREALLKQDAAAVVRYADMTARVRDYVSPSGRIEVKDSQVYYKGYRLQRTFVTRLLQMMEEDEPLLPFVRYIERTMANPQPRCTWALDELINSEHVRHPIPILPDGRILAYKRVRDDYMDFFSGTVLNLPLHEKYKDHPQVGDEDWLQRQVGHRVGMPRWECDDNFLVACSVGFHAGPYEYIRTFHGGEGHIIAVAVCPSQVVSVPQETWQLKFRTHVYEVRHELSQTFVDRIFDPLGELDTVTPAMYDEDLSGLEDYYAGLDDRRQVDPLVDDDFDL